MKHVCVRPMYMKLIWKGTASPALVLVYMCPYAYVNIYIYVNIYDPCM